MTGTAFRLEGIYPAMLTPFTRGGHSVDFDRAADLANFYLDRGVDGVFLCGTTGEGLLMSLDERKQLVERVVEAAGARGAVLVQTGCLDTRSSVDLTVHAAAAGATAVAAYTPGFYTYDGRSILEHFRAIAKAVRPYPVMLYNIPRCTGNPLSPQLIVRIAESEENIVGMKDSSGDMVHFARVAASMPHGFVLINGADELTYQAYLTGASGSVSITANVVPELFISIREKVLAGDLDGALEAQRALARVMAHLGYGRMLSFYHEGLRLRGFDPGCVRPPQREMSKPEKTALAKVFEAEGLR